MKKCVLQQVLLLFTADTPSSLTGTILLLGGCAVMKRLMSAGLQSMMCSRSSSACSRFMEPSMACVGGVGACENWGYQEGDARVLTGIQSAWAQDCLHARVWMAASCAQGALLLAAQHTSLGRRRSTPSACVHSTAGKALLPHDA